MTLAPSFAVRSMDADDMELATSPFPPADDLDLDPMREPSVEPMQDNTFDHTEDHMDEGSMKADEHSIVHHDDDMLDEELDQITNDIDNEVDMQVYEEDGDADILYDEEEDTLTAEEGVDDILDMGLEDVRDIEKSYQEVEDILGGADVELAPDMDEIQEYMTDNQNTGVEPPNIDLFDGTTTAPAVANEHNEAVESSTADEDHSGVTSVDTKDIQALSDPTTPGEESRGADVSSKDVGEVVTEGNAVEVAERGPSMPEIGEVKNVEATQEKVVSSVQTEEIRAEQRHHLLPVKIVYMHEEMSLFPPLQEDEMSTFFLSDPTLAYDGVDKLLAACREILAGTIGHDDELVLDIPALGLHICEDSKYASELTLVQVLDVYLTLSHNEQTHDAEALYCNLSTRVSLASQYAYLQSAAQEGKTYSQIAADYLDTPEVVGEELDEVGDLDLQVEISESLAQTRGTEVLTGAAADVSTSQGKIDQEGAASVYDQAVQEPATSMDEIPQKDRDTINQVVQEHNRHTDPTLDVVIPKELTARDQNAEEQATDHESLQNDLGHDEHPISLGGPAQQASDLLEDAFINAAAEGDIDQTENDPQGQEHPEYHEHYEHSYDTASSHTIEAEPEPVNAAGPTDDLDNESVTGKSVTGTGNAEDTLQPWSSEDSEDGLFETEDPIEADPTDEPQADADDVKYDPFTAHETAADDSFGIGDFREDEIDLEDQSGQDLLLASGEGAPGITNGHQDNLDELEVPWNEDTLATTPSKNSAKRKAFEDNEMDLLDTATPEPKRRRPS